ncbi:MAG: hypothetical protein JNK72_24970 [Myxococcales bacterium]|nr:hypothetical protein [Myxococcales bacterium]
MTATLPTQPGLFDPHTPSVSPANDAPPAQEPPSVTPSDAALAALPPEAGAANDATAPIDPDDLDAAFARFDKQNPRVYAKLVEFARMAKGRGRKVGIKAIWERVRWYEAIEVERSEGDDYELNNNLTSRYARAIMEREADLRGFFETRVLRTPFKNP